MNTLRMVDIVTTDDNKKFELAGRMAAAIIRFHEENGGCMPQDLVIAGFTSSEVVEHWHMAQALATVELKLLNNK